MSSRGSRGGRGRGRRPAAERDEGKLDDPRIAGRRPSGRKAADSSAKEEPKAQPKQDEPKATEDKAEKTEEKKPATRRRRRSTATRGAAKSTSTSTSTEDKDTAAAQPKGAGPRGEAEDVALSEELGALREAIVAQSQAIESLREAHAHAARRLRLGVFVDVPNLIYGAERDNGGTGHRVDMGKLLAYLSAGRELIRATAYAPVSDNPNEPVEEQRFVAPFVRHDFRIVTKPMKRFADGSIKGNFDVEMALDMVTMADRLDVVAVVSGDADFARAVELLQTQGVRVEVVAFSGSTSIEMRALADHFVEVGAILDQVKV